MLMRDTVGMENWSHPRHFSDGHVALFLGDTSGSLFLCDSETFSGIKSVAWHNGCLAWRLVPKCPGCVHSLLYPKFSLHSDPKQAQYIYN